ncbi:MAG: AraC family transcriptional regulator ligand-binding domain-containing protein [Gemmatimonadaceae bacterium]|nr:AraC family transcriptional regulator ligand-binding domain-containing protein [Gemmatimonadaceae bacterium]
MIALAEPRVARAIPSQASPGTTVSAGYAGGVVDFAVTRGVQRLQLLRSAGIDDATLADADARIPLADYLRLVRGAAALTGDAAFALHWGEAVACAQVAAAGVIGSATGTIRDAFAMLNRYARLTLDFGQAPGEDRYVLQASPAGTWMCDTRPGSEMSPEVTEATFARFVTGIRQRTDAPVVRAVRLRHPAPAHRAAYAAVFRVPVRFGADRNAILFDPAWFDQPVEPTARYAFRVLTAHADAQLATLERSRSCRGMVEALVGPRLSAGVPAMAHVAASLAMSRQTLYRRLQAEGTTFARVVDALREAAAVAYLGQPGTTVQQAAALVGFSEPAAFSRAFKRWTGATPLSWRGGRAGQEGRRPAG